MQQTAIQKALIGLIALTFCASCDAGKMGVVELDSTYQNMEFRVKFKNTSKSMRTVRLTVDFVSNGQSNGHSTEVARMAPNQEGWIAVAGIGETVHYRWTVDSY